MKQTQKLKRSKNGRSGSVLALVLVMIIIITMIGFGLMKVSEGAAMQAVLFQNENIAMLTAEAACENAIFWMSDNPDLLLEMEMPGTSGTITFPDATADYSVDFFGFVGFRPVFEVTANGYCGTYHRSVRMYLTQEISGWEMGMCRIPSGTTSTEEVNFADGETIDMPIHINSYGDPQDGQTDIHIYGDPLFLQPVSMSESRYTASGFDKYSNIIGVFDSGISFDQPKSMITDNASFMKKMNWYKQLVQEQKPAQRFKPQSNPKVDGNIPAIQLEFFVDNANRGCVRITDDCPVVGYQESSSNTWDYKLQSNGNYDRYEKYDIYGYHYIPENAEAAGKRYTRYLKNMEVTPEYGGQQGPPCGMIYVDGNVIIGSRSENTGDPHISQLNTVQGKMTVIATGNIWIADSITVSDRDDQGNTYLRQNDMPALDNPNALGLVAGGVIKVIDPGLVEEISGSMERIRRGRWWENVWVPGPPPQIDGLTYEPVAIKDHGFADGTWHRHLPDPMVVEAAMTVGGGGWGAEHVSRSDGWLVTGGRKDTSPNHQDNLIVRGSITEAIRGVVGTIGVDGYLKQYYFDKRIMTGIIPGGVRLKGKFVTAPGGWMDYRIDPKPQD